MTNNWPAAAEGPSSLDPHEGDLLLSHAVPNCQEAHAETAPARKGHPDLEADSNQEADSTQEAHSEECSRNSADAPRTGAASVRHAGIAACSPA